jgi:glycosyltransferase involved in cell wall biosynthesis
MTIGISAFAGDGGRSGIGQYLSHVISRLPDEAPDERFVVFTTREAVSELGLSHPRLDIVAFPAWFEQPVVNILWHVFLLPMLLRWHRCKAVYLPAGNRRLGWWYGVPSVGTVHDLAQLQVEDKYDRWRMFYARSLLPAFMRRLTRVISVSEATGRDLVNRAGVAAESIRLVPNGFDQNRFQSTDRAAAAKRVASRWNVVDPYLLYVARIEHPGKNHVGLLEAYARLRATGLRHKLVLAGSPWSGADVVEATARELGIADDVVFTGFVPNEALGDLYAAADVFVFPSLFEGFGIPLLEAMMAGVPVCASDRASIPEVVGDAGLLFDPDDSSSIETCIRRLLEDPQLRQRMIRAGRQRARAFTWEAAAGRVVNVLREAQA